MNAHSAALPAHVEVLSDVELPFEGSDWYELADPTHFWMRWRLAEALRLLRSAGLSATDPLRGLDVGGGVGVVRGQFEAATDWTVDLGELDTTALRHGTPGRGRTLHYDILERHAPLEHAYDVIVLFDVLEHVSDTAPFVDALLWHLAPGGHLLVNVPALPRGYSKYDDAAGHVRRYTKSSLAAELPASTEIVDMRYWGLGLMPLLFARKAWLETAGRKNTREQTLRSGFKSPGPIGSGLLDVLMRSELRTLDPAPIGTSLMLCARNAST